jgi:hypothetical protein
MAHRLRFVVLFGAIAMTLVAALPQLGITAGARPARPAAVTGQPLVHGSSACVPGSTRCDPGAPTTPGGVMLWQAAAFAAVAAMIIDASRRADRTTPWLRLASGVGRLVHRPPRPLSLAH